MSLEIGPFVVDDETGSVYKKRVAMKWGGKASQLFVLLLKNAPDTISKEMIFAEVWKGRVVTENTLYKTISKLRQEINPEGVEIESVFGEGYRIITSDPPEQSSKTKQPHIKLMTQVVMAVGVLALMALIYTWQAKEKLVDKMVELDKHLAVTKQAFISQMHRRNELGELLSKRFELKKEDSWEKRFYQLHDQMNEQELFLCEQIRAYTDGPMFDSNLAILSLLNNNADMVAAVPLSQDLISHLTLWLNKYSKVFKNSRKMCLLYVGVEDGAAYPSGFDELVASWLEKNQ